MTPRKPKPRKPAPRKASGPMLAKRIATIEARLKALETRSRYRDASHDEPVSNGSEAIGHFTLTEPDRRWWRRFLDYMGAP